MRALLVFCLACAVEARGELPRAMLDALRASGLPQDAAAVVVQRVSDGATVLSHNADRSMQPASTLKPLIALVALETLGPDYRGRSEILAEGEIDAGTLRGNLVLRGRGDVDLDWRALERMLSLARLKGIREIRGDFVVDRTFFEPARTDVGLAPFDGTPEFRYNFVPDALSLNMNLVELQMVSDGDRVAVAFSPELDEVRFVSEFKLVERKCADWEDGWILPTVETDRRGAIVVRLRGDFPRGCSASTQINVIDRGVFAERLFRAMWKRLGGSFRGRVRDGAASSDAEVVATHRSRTLAELLRDINKDSDNPVTRVVYLLLGASSKADPALPTAARAEHEVRAWLARNGIEQEGLVLENGSGLSRLERIRPAQLAAVMRAGLRSDWSAEFISSLPVAALDGGMRTRLTQSVAARKARIKTGTLSNTSAVAGFVTDTRGDMYVVAAIINDDAAKREIARPVLDLLVDWVAARGSAGSSP
ncbi:MAG TPA: D-alanyl-D-alanine carboxypeptidase/D-alanyl-D-alanine-endopeptidase [Usitatibacter sp.]|nr:D-alanyl-D-alanine carboxypeptidase/D-alanyl-D-alanine-endopeptidase [Usitatibacter sp.]